MHTIYIDVSHYFTCGTGVEPVRAGTRKISHRLTCLSLLAYGLEICFASSLFESNLENPLSFFDEER